MEIKRYPVVKNDPLQGWDSADELLLSHVRTLNLAQKRILIINDHFGALSCGIMGQDITSYTDSFVSAQAIKLNSENKIHPIHDLNALSAIYDYVLIQIPKNMSYFEDILCHLSEHLGPHSQVICASMVKHLAPTSFDLLNKYIGETTTSLAKKKARLIFAKFQKSKIESPYPKSIQIEGFDEPFVNYSNVFSREKLDIGTRFFLEHIPQGTFSKILDLGCANGVVGRKAQLLNPKSQIIFSDESWMGILSAKANNVQGEFLWTNCYENQPAHSIDLVLCNPPFHQQTTIGDFIARQMFQDAFHVLKKGGILRVIGNSHLGYQVLLKKIFGKSQIIATNQKFIICEAQKE